VSNTIELIIPNEVEFLLRDSTLRLNAADRDGLIQFNGRYESDHVVFWRSGPRVLLMTAGHDPDWFADIHRVLGLEPPAVVSPRTDTGMLVVDLFRDGSAQAELRRQVCDFDTVQLIYNGPTPDIYRLAEIVRSWGPTVRIDGCEERDYWSSLYLDNKLSVLDLAREVPSVAAAPAVTVNSPEELRGSVAAMLALHDKVIVRSTLGYAGHGSAVTTADPDRMTVLYQRIASDSFFHFPLIVQKFIEQPPEVGCPAADVLVGPDGARKIVPCSLKVSGGHSFEYVNVGPAALPPVWTQRLEQVSRDVGLAVSRLGFRGWLSIDCVAGADEQLYVTELNSRRSGSLHAVGLLDLWGADAGLTISAQFTLPLPTGLSYAEDVRPVFVKLWEAGVRVFPTTVRGLGWDEPMLAVIAAASTATEAEQIIESLHESLSARPALAAR
jgi:hypothetical protein